MPEPDKIKGPDDKIEIPKSKKGVSIKLIIIGAAGYLTVLGLMIVGIVYFLKPDVTPVVGVEPVVKATQVPGSSTKDDDLNDPDIYEAAQDFGEDPESIDISEIVTELKEIEYKSNLRNKMEQDSIARLQAERETKIAQAKFQELKIQTAKLIAARPKPKEAAPKEEIKDSDNFKATQTAASEKPNSKKGLKQLAKIYSSMKPADAAKIFDKMETKLVVNLLSNMKDRNAAKILSSLKPEKAARLSKKINDKLAQI